MHMRKFSPLLFQLSVGLLWILLAGCALGNAGSLSTTSAGTFPVDPQLKSFYAKGGGLDIFGPAISEVTIQEYIRCQLMENARICVNTNQSGTGKFSLSPLGRQLGIPINSGVESSAIFPDFVPLIAQLGEENVGPALDKVRYNYQESRVEQYFEKVGFYHGMDEPAGTVHLLPYGDFVCGSACML